MFRRLKLSFRAKLAIAAAIPALLIATSLAWLHASDLRKDSVEALTREGRQRSNDMMGLCSQLLQDNDADAVAKQVLIYSSKPGVAWVYALNGKGQVLAHSFGDAPPAGLAQLNPPKGSEEGVKVLKLGGMDGVDIATPVLDGSAGAVHVGMDLGPSQAGTRKRILAAFGLSLSVLGAAMALLWWALGRQMRALLELRRAVTRIADDGDLSSEIHIRTGDELEDMAAAYNSLLARLRILPVQLSEAVQTIAEATLALEKSMEGQGQLVTRQATALQQTQVTAEEIRLTSQAAARMAETVLGTALQAESLGTDGEKGVEATLGALNGIRAQVDAASGKFAELRDSARQVSRITAAVKELADQSNILALNAGIEAVRAGEHGKGFALVAREIRRLADQSVQSTAQVRTILEGIERAIDDAAKDSASGSRGAEEGMEKAKRGGEALRALAGLIKASGESARQIATAVSQQNAGITQVFSAVEDQNRMMEETLRGLEESRQNASRLRGLNAGLSKIVGSYRN